MKYAMPVHPKVLEKDFESDEYVSEDIDRLMGLLSVKNSMSDFSKSDIEFVKSKIQSLWFLINLKREINLRDREKLYPVFKEMNRVFKGNKTIPVAYRGVRMPLFSPRGISNNDPEVKEILEGLAYGLRSWTQTKIGGLSWAKGLEDSTSSKLS